MKEILVSREPSTEGLDVKTSILSSCISGTRGPMSEANSVLLDHKRVTSSRRLMVIAQDHFLSFKLSIHLLQKSRVNKFR